MKFYLLQCKFKKKKKKKTGEIEIIHMDLLNEIYAKVTYLF